METKLWIWRGIRLELPPDWELLQFSKRREAGSIAFADRYRYRLQMHWREPEGEPDMERTVACHAAKVRETHPDAAVRAGERGPWVGVEVGLRGETTARYMRYFAEEGLLVECVFPAAGEPSGADATGVLEGVGPSAEAGRWVAFGMDFVQPDGARLETCQVQPGLAVMTFCGGERAPVRHGFSRRGMLRNWLSGSVEDWMALQAPGSMEATGRGAESRDGHDVHFLAGTFRERPSGGWRRSRRNYRAAAWVCPEDGRLFHEALVGPGDLPEPRALSCCAGNGGRSRG